jgi:hypothetical protein
MNGKRTTNENIQQQGVADSHSLKYQSTGIMFEYG